MLTSKQRSYLRAQAHGISPIFQVGKSGVFEEMCLQIGNALEARELIKIRVLDNCDYGVRDVAEEISAAVSADVVSVTGATFLLYRKSQKKPRIELP